MPLTQQKIEQFRRSIQLALNHEWPELTKITRRLSEIPRYHIPTELGGGAPVIATAAADGGEGRLVLDPIRLHVVRVANSAGEIFCEEFVPLSLAAEEILRFFIRSNPRVQRFLNYLDLSWSDLIPPRTLEAGDLLQVLREILEWASLLLLAHDSRPKVLLHDGLLRTVVIPDTAFRAISRKLESLTKQHGHLLAGVSKRSQIVNYLSAGLSADPRFREAGRYYLPVPSDLEAAAAPPAYRWNRGRNMGTLFLARLDEGGQVPFMPVDVAVWQTDRAAEAMSLIAQDSRGSFPVRGYPTALITADRYARIGGLETELLESLVLGELAERDPVVARQAREQMLLGRRLAQSFADESDVV